MTQSLHRPSIVLINGKSNRTMWADRKYNHCTDYNYNNKMTSGLESQFNKRSWVVEKQARHWDYVALIDSDWLSTGPSVDRRAEPSWAVYVPPDNVCCDGIRSTAAAAKVNNNSKANQLIGCQSVGDDSLDISLNNLPSTASSSSSSSVTKDKCKNSYTLDCVLLTFTPYSRHLILPPSLIYVLHMILTS